MTGKTLDVPIDGPPVSQTPALAHGCEISGLRAVVLPPGDVELALTPHWHVVNAVPIAGRLDVLRVGGEDLSHLRFPAASICWTPRDADVRIVCHNPGWEINVEFDPERTEALAHEALEGKRVPEEFVFWRRDPIGVGAASLLIEHLRRPVVDPLFAEGLMLAMLGRALRIGAGLNEPSTNGVDTRLLRVIDYIDAHLESRMSTAELAAVAGMSPWYFIRAFRGETGRSPYQYVLQRRVARTRELLASSEMSLAQVALACGFASQSHMNDLFRRRLGITPGRYRRQVKP